MDTSMISKELFIDLVGITGVTCVLVTYLLIQIGRLSANSILYSSLNLLGSILILYSLLYHWNTASVIIEIAWGIISIFGLCRVIKKKRENSA